MTPSPGNRLSGGLHLPHPPLRIARDKRNSGYRYAMCRECAVRLVLPHDPRVYDVKLQVERPTPSSFCHSGRMATDTYESDASLAAFRAITEAPYVLRKQVDGRGRVSSRCALLVSAFHRYIGPFNRPRITPLNRFRIVEDLASSGPVVRTQFPKLPLAFVPPEGSVLILVVENSPKLETRVGNGQWNTVSARQVLRFVESRMDISIEHRPYGIACRERIVLQFPRFLDCPFDHCSWITTDTNRDQPCGSASMETVECLQIRRFGGYSFRDDHDSRGQRACAMAPRNAPRAAHDSAGIPLSPNETKKSSPAGTPPMRPFRYAFSMSSRERNLKSVSGVNRVMPS